jgi:hypothetical protein
MKTVREEILPFTQKPKVCYTIVLYIDEYYKGLSMSLLTKIFLSLLRKERV